MKTVSVVFQKHLSQFPDQLVSYDITASPQKAIKSRSQTFPMDKTLRSDQLLLPPCLPIIAMLYFPVREPLWSLSDSHPAPQQGPEELQVAMLNLVLFFSIKGWAGFSGRPFERFIKLTN